MLLIIFVGSNLGRSNDTNRGETLKFKFGKTERGVDLDSNGFDIVGFASDSGLASGR